jgi:hypothetical protein
MSRQILNGWKQISNHLERGIRTAQRWEVLGMPVHRPALKDRSAVVAFSDELELWLARTSPGAQDKCVPIRDKEESNETLLRKLDQMSALVRRTRDLICQMRTFQKQRWRLRKIRYHRVGWRARVRAASTPARVRGSVLAFPRRQHSFPPESRGNAGFVLGAGPVPPEKARLQG